jgi:hypothetical protein
MSVPLHELAAAAESKLGPVTDPCQPQPQQQHPVVSSQGLGSGVSVSTLLPYDATRSEALSSTHLQLWPYGAARESVYMKTHLQECDVSDQSRAKLVEPVSGEAASSRRVLAQTAQQLLPHLIILVSKRAADPLIRVLKLIHSARSRVPLPPLTASVPASASASPASSVSAAALSSSSAADSASFTTARYQMLHLCFDPRGQRYFLVWICDTTEAAAAAAASSSTSASASTGQGTAVVWELQFAEAKAGSRLASRSGSLLCRSAPVTNRLFCCDRAWFADGAQSKASLLFR